MKFSKIKFPDGNDSNEMDRLASVFNESVNIKEKEPEVVKLEPFTR